MKERQQYLRNEIKKYKWYAGISYREVAEALNINYNSFINWIHGYYDFGEKRTKQLEHYIMSLKY